jgi:uncharacterized protein (DUF697 family)
MNMRAWLQQAWQGMGAGARPEAGAGHGTGNLSGDYGGSGSVLRGLTGRSMEMAEVQAEVAAECRGQILVVGRCDEAVRRFLAHVRGQPPAPPAGPVYCEGFFTLATLPAAAVDCSPSATGYGTEADRTAEEWVALGREADVLLYVFRQDVGWQADDARWYARLRATGQPLVLVEADLPSNPQSEDDLPPNPLPPKEGEQDAPSSATALPAGDRAVQMCLSDPLGHGDALPADVIALVERILAQRPKLGIPLAQEIPGCRPLIAQRAIRSGVLMTTLLGAQPIPLLDLPLQVALNWKLALQLGAIYGRPGLDHRSREMISTVLWNLALRYVIQQVLKLAPVIGWVASAALSGTGTWVLGNALVRYYQMEGRPGVRKQGSGDREQGMDGRWQIANRKWQAAKRKGTTTVGHVQGATSQWRQAAATRCCGLRGRLAARTAALGKRRGGVTPDEPR